MPKVSSETSYITGISIDEEGRGGGGEGIGIYSGTAQ